MSEKIQDTLAGAYFIIAPIMAATVAIIVWKQGPTTLSTAEIGILSTMIGFFYGLFWPVAIILLAMFAIGNPSIGH